MRCALLALLPLCACVAGTDPTGSVGRLTLEYQVGEELMTDCTERQQRCPDWLEFKKEWEAEAGYLTTFERSLAQHKARLAAGQSV